LTPPAPYAILSATSQGEGRDVKQEVPLARAHRLLAGQPACLLTVHYRGRENVMALGWACPVSLAPPLLALAIHPASYTHDLLARGQECVLNIPGRPYAEQLVRCGSVSGADGDKLRESGLTPAQARRVEAPWIDECLAHIECAVIERLAPGDHTIFVVQVVGAWAEEEAFGQTWLVDDQQEDLLPLHHLGGGWFGLMGRSLHVGQEAESDDD
jgi:flavin reductase (DIM6/NTAB) family NADH-FMN oxidoreductase RutF